MDTRQDFVDLRLHAWNSSRSWRTFTSRGGAELLFATVVPTQGRAAAHRDLSGTVGTTVEGFGTEP
jgi:hypothetical protein